jgi:hypothetical protein
MAILLGALCFLVGSFALISELLRRAPEGYEDERGFHFVDQLSKPADPLSSGEHSLPQPSRRVA